LFELLETQQLMAAEPVVTLIPKQSQLLAELMAAAPPKSR
jgi:hypothetical protein